MSIDQIVTLIVGLGGASGLIAWVRRRDDRKAGISSDERLARRDKAEDRRDTIADRDGLIARLEARLENVEERLTEVERELSLEREWNQLLLAHIWRGDPPPPPPRPKAA